MTNKQRQPSTNRPTDQHSLESAVQHHLNAEVDNLDFNVTSKLAAARHRAMSQQAPESQTISGWFPANWLPLAGTAAALVVALVVGNQLYSPGVESDIAEPTQIASSELIEGLPILSSNDDIEFYQAIEFLEWMESNSG